MPTVPYTGVPATSLSSQGVSQVNAPANEQQFGAGVGQATQMFGRQIEHGADELFSTAMKFQNLENEAKARQASTNYMIEAGKLHAAFESQTGLNAGPAALEKHVNSLRELRESMRGTLGNPMVRKMYDFETMTTMGHSIFSAARHSGTQMKSAAVASTDAQIEASTNAIANISDDETAVGSYIDGIKRASRSKAAIMGLPKDAADEAESNAVSGAMAARIIGLSKSQPLKAEEMLGDPNIKLNGPDRQKAENAVRGNVMTTGARMVSQMILPGLDKELDKPLAEYIAAGEQMAAEKYPKDPLFKEAVAQRIRADYNLRKAEVTNEYQLANQTITDVLAKSMERGTPPTTLDELMVMDPSVGPAWEKMKPQDRIRVMKALANNADPENRVTWNQDTLKEYQRLKGMAMSDTSAFLGEDVLNANVPNQAKRELINLQSRLTKQAWDDPRVNHAVQVLKPMMDAAGIVKRANQTNPEYYQFLGALQDAISIDQKKGGKVLSDEEIRTVGARLMQETNKDRWFFQSSQTLWNTPVPDDVKTQIKSDPQWAEKGIEPTDEMIQRVYVRELYRRTYGAKAATKSEK